MERQFLNTVFLLFILAGCQQVEINPVDISSNKENLYSSDEFDIANKVDISIWTYIQKNNSSKDNVVLDEQTLAYMNGARASSKKTDLVDF